MKRNEVRIGNIIECTWYDMDKVYTEIIPININDLIDIEDEDYKPVPLTEEWLLKCEQIEKIADGLFVFKLPFNYEIRIVEGKKGYTFWVQNTLLSANIDYLHHLQNFYFTIKNEELTFNLK